MDEDLAQMVRETLASERFGVLTTVADGRMHSATILFAEAPGWELVHAIRPVTLKAQLGAASPDVVFQVDNRGVTVSDRTRFIRLGFEGELRFVSRNSPTWGRYRDIYAAKLPFGAAILDSLEVELYVLTSHTLRVAAGARPAEDFSVPPPDAEEPAQDAVEHDDEMDGPADESMADPTRRDWQ